MRSKVQKKKILNDECVSEVFDRLALAWPNAHCELVHNTPFQLLLAVVLSAQATDKSVNKALEPLFKSQPNFGPGDLVKMGELGFLNHIRSIGLAPTKAKNSFRLAQSLLKSHKGKVPLTRGDLEELPGVGRKTANVVLNVLCGLPTMAVDTHVARLAVRIGISEPTEDRLKIEETLLKRVPERHLVRAHHYLIFHGRYHCTARAPKCPTCPLEDVCPKVGVL